MAEWRVDEMVVSMVEMLAVSTVVRKVVWMAALRAAKSVGASVDK